MLPRRRALAQNTIGARLYALRITHNLTQQELAAQIGVSRSYIAQIETGRCLPALDALKRLATDFQVTVDFLRHGAELSCSIKSRLVEDPETLLLLSLWNQAPTLARPLILRMIRAAIEE